MRLHIKKTKGYGLYQLITKLTSTVTINSATIINHVSTTKKYNLENYKFS